MADTANAGYSGTPPAKKVGVRPGHMVVVVRRPDGWELPGLPDGAHLKDGDEIGDADIVIAFVREPAELAGDIPGFTAGLRPASSLWIAWPRKAAGHASDVTENLLREMLLPTGLVDIKVAALDHDWSGLKFMWRKERRTK